jgi:16S rRNA processing protein RimM
MHEGERWIALGVVARPHGVHGEIRIQLFNRDSDLLLTLEEVLVRDSSGVEQEVSVDSARRANDAILLKLYSVDDRDRADELRGAVLCGRRRDFPPIAADEFYICDLEGARVVLDDGDNPRRELGRVRELRSYPTVDALVVDRVEGGDPLEFPLVDSIVKSVDVREGLVLVSTLLSVDAP